MPSPILDLAYCESESLALHPGKIYRFTPHIGCLKCIRMMDDYNQAMEGLNDFTPIVAIDPNAVEPPKYAYSRDQEEYYGEFDSREEACAEGAGDPDMSAGMHMAVWTGRIKHVLEYLNPHADRFGEDIIERINEWMYDEVGGDDDVVELSRPQMEELGLLVLDYLKHNAAFKRWGVTAVEEHLEIAR